MHEGDQRLLFTFGQQAFEILQIDMPVRIDLYKTQGCLSSLMQVFHSMQRRMMLDGGTDDMCASEITHRGEDGGVAAFRTTAREEDLSGMSVQDLRHRFTGILHGQSCLPAI